MDAHNPLSVGIDIGRSKADYCLMLPNGQPVIAHCSLDNSMQGFQEAHQLILNTLKSGKFDGVKFAIEATSYYWLPLFTQLYLDEALLPYQPQLTLLNAGWVSWFKKSFSPDHKTDQRDPFYIADRIRTLSQPISWHYDPHWLKLRLLTRSHFHLVDSMVREKNFYQLHLFLAYSSYTTSHAFSDPFGKLSQYLLSHPELLEEFAELPLRELAQELNDLSYRPLKKPAETAFRLRESLHKSYPVLPDLEETLHTILSSFSTVIKNIKSEISFIDKQISNLVAQDYPEVDLLRSIPGIGPVFSSGIAAEIGDIQRFFDPPKWDKKLNSYRRRNCRDAEDAIAKQAGLWWPKRSSGNFTAEEHPMSKKGNAYLRYYFIEAADRMRQSIPAYRNFYDKKFAEASKHHHKRAVVLSGRKAIGLVVGLLFHHQVYKPEEVHP